ncbi:MAG: hypothetical protein J5879_05230 [Clostridia bacterium]|nr:hypothetical protein [Clostridia bacterium]
MAGKRYVSVSAEFDSDGNMRPSVIHLDSGQDIRIKRVKNVTRAASLRAGGQGTRFLCNIGRQDIFLFYEGPRWFIEV